VLLALLLAGPGFAASLALDKGSRVLGRFESLGVTLSADEAPGTEDRPLRLSVNVGSFGEVTRIGPGKYRSVYLPPPTRFPQMALVAVWRETGPDAPIEFLRIPLYGSTRIPITAAPGSEVRIQVGPDSFGPVACDARGHAVVPVEVPPGVREATLIVKERTGLETHKDVPVEVPPYNRLTAALVPHAVQTDGAEFARLVVLYDLDGTHPSPDKVKLEASLGTPAFERSEGGRYIYRFTPPQAAAAKEVRFDVTVKGDPTARASTLLSLGLPPVAKVVVRPPPSPLACDGKSTAAVSALVFDAAGMGLSGQTVELLADDKPLPGLRYLGNGLYSATYTAPSSYPPGGLVQFTARARDSSGAAVSGATNYQLRAAAMPRALTARFSPDPVPADGKTQATLVLDVRDGAGLPLDGAKLMLVASHGTLSPLEGQGEGRYQTTYSAPAMLPAGEAFIRVVDSSGAFESKVELPLREDPHHLLAGLRAGFTHSLGSQLGPRFGVDVKVPFHVGGSALALGLSALYAQASQTVSDSSGALSSQSSATFIPASLRLGYELYAGRRLAVTAGVGGMATWAQFQTSLTGATATRWGFGGLAFVELSVAAGPGQLFGDLSGALAPVESQAFRLEAGGVGLEVGYRFGIL
jgi:hypothetical protein